MDQAPPYFSVPAMGRDRDHNHDCGGSGGGICAQIVTAMAVAYKGGQHQCVCLGPCMGRQPLSSSWLREEMQRQARSTASGDARDKVDEMSPLVTKVPCLTKPPLPICILSLPLAPFLSLKPRQPPGPGSKLTMGPSAMVACQVRGHAPPDQPQALSLK
jgi:hypothetical protein